MDLAEIQALADLVNEEGQLINLKLADVSVDGSFYDRYDLTYSEMKICMFLFNNGEQTMTAIAKFLNKKRSNLTRVIEKLVEKGLVERIQKQNDRRSIYIKLTKKSLKQSDGYAAVMAKNLQYNIEKHCPDKGKRLFDAYKYIVETFRKFTKMDK